MATNRTATVVPGEHAFFCSQCNAVLAQGTYLIEVTLSNNTPYYVTQKSTHTCCGVEHKVPLAFDERHEALQRLAHIIRAMSDVTEFLRTYGMIRRDMVDAHKPPP